MGHTSTGRFTSAAAACLLVLGSFNASAAPIAPTNGSGGVVASGRIRGLSTALTANTGAQDAFARGDLANATVEVARALEDLRAVRADCAGDAGLAELGGFAGEIIGKLERIAADLPPGRAVEADFEQVHQDLMTALTTLAR